MSDPIIDGHPAVVAIDQHLARLDEEPEEGRGGGEA